MEDLLDRIDVVEKQFNELTELARQLTLENQAMKMMINAEMRQYCGFFCALPECAKQLNKEF